MIHIIDLKDIVSGRDKRGYEASSYPAQVDVCQQLDKAFSTTGFAYLKNHGIDHETIERVFKASKDFFLLPEDVKSSYPRNMSDCDGYRGKNPSTWVDNKRDLRESFNVTSLMMQPEMYPDYHVPNFREAVSDLIPQLCQLALQLFELMALALGLEKDYFVSRHQCLFEGADKNGSSLRSLYYPALSYEQVRDGVGRIGAHIDHAFTLLLQDNTGGLEVSIENEWIPVIPIPGTMPPYS